MTIFRWHCGSRGEDAVPKTNEGRVLGEYVPRLWCKRWKNSRMEGGRRIAVPTTSWPPLSAAGRCLNVLRVHSFVPQEEWSEIAGGYWRRRRRAWGGGWGGRRRLLVRRVYYPCCRRERLPDGCRPRCPGNVDFATFLLAGKLKRAFLSSGRGDVPVSRPSASCACVVKMTFWGSVTREKRGVRCPCEHVLL